MNSANPDWIMADSCWHSTRNLLASWPPQSGTDARLLRLEPIDWRNARARGIRPWHWGVHRRELSRQVRLIEAELPPGWMKSFPRLGQWPLARACRKWQKERIRTGTKTSLWITYPFYLALAEQVRPESLVYYNLDDYTLYWPAKADAVRDWEARAVRRADWTVCVAAERARQLRIAIPERADRILHVPHGAPESTIPREPFLEAGPAPEELAHIPRPWLGYLGGLEDRVDWSLVRKIAETYPDTSIVLVGPRPNPDGSESWRAEARAAMARSNVYAPGSVPQERIGEVYASFDVNLTPYDVSHAFNVVCSPTKLMDAMGCGRPMVATDLPECRRYEGLYHVGRDHGDFLAKLGRVIEAGFRDGQEESRWLYARRHASAVILDKLYRLSLCGDPNSARRVLAPEAPIG